MTIKLADLPNTCQELVEYLELIIVAETLTGSDYSIRRFGDSWKVFIRNLFVLDIPLVTTEFRPAYVPILKEELTRNVSNLTAFEEEIKNSKIVIVKNESTRSQGYVTIQGNHPNPIVSHWQFMFVNQKSLYDFYLIGKNHKVF